MNAAIYCRKSTEQVGRAKDTLSITRQEELARAFADQQGWAVRDEDVFVDDGISGAEFERRPGYQRLLSALTPRPRFAILIVSEQKSLGRESYETNYTIKRLAQAGVQIVEYVHGRSLTPKNWIDKVTSAVLSSVDEGHREQTRERVHEAHKRLASKGYCVGGRCFGYRNVNIYIGVDQHGRPAKSHVDREIVPEEAVIVRRVFTMFTEGSGLKSIARQLTREGAPSPKPFVQRDGLGLAPLRGWSPSTIRALLSRDLYRGVVTWNRSRKRDEWGQVAQRPREVTDRIEARREDLRIVPEELWNRAASRRREVEGVTLRFGSGRISGRPPKDAIQNLLAGLATCSVCGGGLVVETYKSSSNKPRISHYVCNRRRMNGSCDNALRIPVTDMNEAVLQAIEEHALTPEAIEQVIALSERSDQEDQADRLQREQKDTNRRISRLVAAVEKGGDVPSLVSALRELEARKVAIAEELAGLRPLPRLPSEVVENRLAEWRRLLRQSTTQGRAVLQRVLRGRITFTPAGSGYTPAATGYTFTAATRFDKLFAGVAIPAPPFLPRSDSRGLDHIGTDDTLDGDYGRLLERVSNRKGMASPGVPSWNQILSFLQQMEQLRETAGLAS